MESNTEQDRAEYRGLLVTAVGGRLQPPDWTRLNELADRLGQDETGRIHDEMRQCA